MMMRLAFLLTVAFVAVLLPQVADARDCEDCWNATCLDLRGYKPQCPTPVREPPPAQPPSARQRLPPAPEPPPPAPPPAARQRLPPASEPPPEPEPADVAFESTPPGAAVILDGEKVCSRAPCSVRVEPGHHFVEMTLEHHRTATTQGPLAGSVKLTLEPKDAELVVLMAPNGGAFEVNGVTYSASPVQKVRVPPGFHRVRTKDRCLVEDFKVVDATPGGSHQVRLSTQPVEVGVRVTAYNDARTELAGTVYVNGAPVGRTATRLVAPLCLDEIEVVLDDGRRESSSFHLVPNVLNDVEVQFGGRAVVPLARVEEPAPVRPRPSVTRGALAPTVEPLRVRPRHFAIGGAVIGTILWLAAGSAAIATHEDLKAMPAGDPRVGATIETGKGWALLANVGLVVGAASALAIPSTEPLR